MDTDIDNLSLQAQIGQVLAVGFHGTTPSRQIIDLIQHHHIGNIILFKRNLESTQQIFDLTQSLQKIAYEAGHPHPLLIMVDQEHGMLRRFGTNATIFPGNMALGAIDSEDLAYEIARASGNELKAMGINLNLAPVIDVNNNPENPVIGVRSFGEDPYRVGKLGAAMVKGYQAAGIASCVKHFPGHGDTAVDSHLALPTISHDLQRLTSLEFIPFTIALEADVECVMVAHIYLPALMTHEKMLPASISPTILTHILRKQLGFSGLIISDCMEMQALADTVGTERGCVLGLQAGLDMVLVSHTYQRQLGCISAITNALDNGELSPMRLRDAAAQVLRLKARTLSWDALPKASSLATIHSLPHHQLRDQAYARSTTLVRDHASLLPLQLPSADRLLLLFLQPASLTQAIDGDQSRETFTLIEDIRRRHPATDTLTITSYGEHDYKTIEHAVSQATRTIILTMNANLDPAQGSLVRRLLQTDCPIIAIAVYNPYDLLAFPEAKTYLVTYENTGPALHALAAILFGESEAQGHLPVTLYTN